jgi:drug/metabolite transporter (DMT)-like permease
VIIGLAWVFLAVVWGTTWSVIKIGLEDLPPVSFAGLRFAAAAVILWTIILSTRRRVPRDRSAWVLIGSTALITISLQYGLQFWGQQHVASGLSAVITSTIPVFTALFAHMLLPEERLTARSIAGISLGFAGIVVIFSDQLTSQGVLALAGSGALIVASTATSRAQISVKQWAGRIDPIVFTGGQFAIGCVPLVIGGMIIDGSPAGFEWTRNAVFALLYLAVFGSALAFGVMYWLFTKMAITRVMLVAFVNPIVALAAGWVFLGERLTWTAWLGGGLVLAGVALVLRVNGLVRFAPGQSPPRSPAL